MLQLMIRPLSFLTLVVILGLGINYALAQTWTPPTASPPGGNTPTLINVGPTHQTKSGGLGVGSLVVDGGAVFGGSVGVGRTAVPQARLHVNGDIIMGHPQEIHGATHRQFILHGAWNNLYIAPRNDANTGWLWDRFVITSGGNVGIGTWSPGTRLDVVGTARMTGFQLGTAATPGHVLTADASGRGTWQAAPAGGGGSGTIVFSCPRIGLGGNVCYTECLGQLQAGISICNYTYIDWRNDNACTAPTTAQCTPIGRLIAL